MTNVKVTLTSKNGNEYEALVPITTACKAMFDTGSNTTNISRMGYSVARKCHDYLVSKARNTSQRAQLNMEIKILYNAMECTKSILFTNGVELYED